VSILRKLAQQAELRDVPRNWFAAGWEPGNRAAGVAVNQDNATSIGAVYASVKLYADTIAALPMGAYIRDRGVRRPVTRPRWMDNPIPNNPNYTAFEFRHRIVSSLLLDGNAFILILRDENDEIVETRPLDPRKVEIKRGEFGEPLYRINGTDGQHVTVTAEQMVHIPLFAYGENDRGLSPVEHHRVTMGLATATQLYGAKFYEQGASPSGIIKVPGELNAEQAQQLRESFGRKHEGIDKMHKVAVLTGGADFQMMSMKIADMELVETLHWGVESIARIYGVPLHLLQYPGGNSSYASVEAVGIEWLRLGLGPLVARIEAGLQRLIVGDTTFVRFNLDSLLRPTTKERYDAYAIALNNGWLSLNEIRALEDRSPITDPEGSDFRKPLNIGYIGEPANTPTEG
jgi:HK97 family phage portal protein